MASSPFVCPSRVLARLVSLAQIGELARRLELSEFEISGFYGTNKGKKPVKFIVQTSFGEKLKQKGA